MALLLQRTIGFCITHLNGQRDAAINFVVTQGLVSLQVARDIVDSTVPVNVYASGVTPQLLLNQLFSVIPVALEPGLNVISTTSSKLTLPTPLGQTITLLATGIIQVADSYADYWKEYALKGLIRFILFAGISTDFSPLDYAATDYLV